MATTITWGIANLERNTADGIVFAVHYIIDATDGTYKAGAYGSIGLEAPEPEEEIPYADLTPEIVISWVKDKLTEQKVTAIEEALKTQIEEQHTPSKAVGVPW